MFNFKLRLFTIIIVIAFFSSNVYSYDDNIEKIKTNYMKQEYVKLNNGYKMPMIGFGTWTFNNQEAEEFVYLAIKNGYRLIDTAEYYGNEKGVGEGIRKAINEGLIKREDIFITTKILPFSFNDYEKKIENSNKILGLDYIDLMLVHQKGFGDKKLYNAIEKSIEKGIVRSAGISNYYTPSEVDDFIKKIKIKPAIIQNENHIYYQNINLQNYIKKYGTIIESWYPLGGRGNIQDHLNNSIIKELSLKYKKTPSQIILRWQIQAGFIVIPSSKKIQHIIDNINIFDFKLSNDDMKKIEKINKNQRYENY